MSKFAKELLQDVFYKVGYLIILIIFCLSSLYAQQENCNIKIIQSDSIIFSLTPYEITLCTNDSADYYTWYCDGEIIDSCSPSITVTIQPNETKTFTVKAGFELDTNYIPNPDFEDGFTGFTMDTSLSISDTLTYNSGHYNIGVSTDDFVNDICHNNFAQSYVSTISNGTKALMVAPRSPCICNDTISLYKTKFQVKPQRDYVFYYSYKTAVKNCGSPYSTTTFNRFLINNQTFKENTYTPTYDYSTMQVLNWHYGCNYSINATPTIASYFLHKRSERFFVANDSIAIDLQARQTTSQGLKFAFFVLDSFAVREVCYSYDTVTISVVNTFTSYDTSVYLSACEKDFPLYFRENELNENGTYTFSYKDSVNFIDTIFTVNVTKYYSFVDTIFAEILKGETYLDNNFSEDSEGVYSLSYTSVNGCDSVICLDLNVISLKFPTIVTPNNDGINDIFEIYDLLNQSYFKENHLVIYNRYGRKVYDKMNIKEYDDFWNPNKTNSSTGTYFYRFSAKGKKKDLVFTGSLEVLR